MAVRRRRPQLAKQKLLFLEDDMTQQQQNIRIWWDASVQAYRMASPFNKELVEGLKGLIPHSDRSFDPNTKIWTFVEKWLTPTALMLKLLQCSPTVITKAQSEQAAQSTGTTAPRRGAPLADTALEFLRVAGQDAMLKAFRAAALTHHPDRGGSMDSMSTLNALWDRIQKEVYGNA